jgi:UDP-N-acetylmuramate--alanine ligase
MNIFFSGIGGVGLGPLAEICRGAGHFVAGSDVTDSLMLQQLRDNEIPISLDQDGTFLRACQAERPIDWYIYSSAISEHHPELLAAKELGLRTSKRDELLAHIIKEKNLKLIAVAGTHGKTTTTGMLIWAFKKMGVPVSYSVGTTLSFGPSGLFDPASEYFVYECDEFDRNFLHFSPELSLITSIGYDHSDTYPQKADYLAAFAAFVKQSGHTIGWQNDLKQLPVVPADSTWQLGNNEVMEIRVPGEHNRRNATLVMKALEYVGVVSATETANPLFGFPGTNRRFEKLADNLYSDYGHHPTEIAATLQLARELSDHVVLVYQPHQNVRQHEIKSLYRNCFKLAEKVYWLPTYLSRENPDLPLLTPESLIKDIANNDSIQIAELDDELWTAIELHRESGDLVLCMGAGSIDGWIRSHL